MNYNTDKELNKVLEKNFGLPSFRLGQEEIIRDIMMGEDVLGVLPTGTGKSLCYQLPSLLFEGLTIVVTPLISLMVDQVKQLKSKGFKRVAAINSLINSDEKQSIVNHIKSYRLIYCSPEMLQNDWFMSRLKEVEVSLFVVDEAHCISQWGHEFRTDYLKLNKVIVELNHPQVLALSATATPQVQKDIMSYLNKPNMKKHIYKMDRENIAFVIEKYTNWIEKVERIVEILSLKPVPTMIYFSSRKWCEQISKLLQDRLPKLRVAYYHGGMESMDRLLIQQQFMNNQLDVICSTSAFGMGVDKQDVRLVIHFHLPTQVESYIQEVGRAGRDGEQSVGLVLHAVGDEQVPLSLIKQELPTDSQVNKVLYYLQQMKSTSIDDLASDVFIRQTINETQWRFLVHQLEKEGIIQNEKLQRKTYDGWEKARYSISSFLKDRIQYKTEMFRQFLNWINSTECRRKTLFEPFQSGYTQPEAICCDYCGPVFDSFEPKIIQFKEKTFEWREHLQKIFQLGDNDEKAI